MNKKIILIIILLILTSAVIFWYTRPLPTVVQIPATTAQVYTFKSINTSKDEFPDYVLQVYKNTTLVKEIKIDSQGEAQNIIISPDTTHVAFSTTHTEGGCMYKQSPSVISLDNFVVTNIDTSNLNKNLTNKLQIESSKTNNEFIVPQRIKDIKWTSDTEMEVTMEFGIKDACPLSDYSKIKNISDTMTEQIDFKLVK